VKEIVMVWGMDIPGSFGDFWPEGQFEGFSEGRGVPLTEGWDERLYAYYGAQPAEIREKLFKFHGDMTYPHFVSGKFKYEIGSARRGEQPFTPILPHEPPQSFDTSKTYKSLASLIALNFGLLAVDDALKSIIERLEPGVHQFFPIAINMSKGQVYPIQYYVLVIGRYFDSFVPEKSNPDSFRTFPDSNQVTNKESKLGVTGLAMRKDVIGGAHLWRERRFMSLLTCFSDTLQDEIVKAGLRMPKHYKMMEV